MSRLAGIALAMILLLPAALHAQQPVTIVDEADWNNLAQLRVWDRIVCTTKDGIWHRGKFVAFSDEALSLRVGRREVGLRREDVVRVWLLGPRNRGKAAQYGFLFTFAGATAITAAKIGGEEDLTPGAKVVISLGIGALFGGIGAGVGAAVAPASKTMIYRAKP